MTDLIDVDVSQTQIYENCELVVIYNVKLPGIPRIGEGFAYYSISGRVKDVQYHADPLDFPNFSVVIRLEDDIKNYKKITTEDFDQFSQSHRVYVYTLEQNELVLAYYPDKSNFPDQARFEELLNFRMPK